MREHDLQAQLRRTITTAAPEGSDMTASWALARPSRDHCTVHRSFDPILRLEPTKCARPLRHDWRVPNRACVFGTHGLAEVNKVAPFSRASLELSCGSPRRRGTLHSARDLLWGSVFD